MLQLVLCFQYLVIPRLKQIDANPANQKGKLLRHRRATIPKALAPTQSNKVTKTPQEHSHVSLLEVQKQLFAEWLQGGDANVARRRVATLALVHNQDQQRMYKSYYRRYVMRVHGSKEWLHAIIALGSLPSDFVELLRKLCAERKALASAQGKLDTGPGKRKDRQHPEDGIHHSVSAAKKEREEAKLLDKKIAYEAERWDAGVSRLSLREWQKLLQQRDDKWDKAEDMSRETGFPFKDRHGNWVNNIQRDMVGMCLTRWCIAHNIEYA